MEIFDTVRDLVVTVWAWFVDHPVTGLGVIMMFAGVYMLATRWRRENEEHR